jgi:hypothetical protein
MTDNEIIKAVEWWITVVNNVGSVTISKNDMLAVYDFINRQKAEIERLYSTINKIGTGIAKVEKILPDMRKEIKAEAIKECIEKTQEFLSTKCRGVVEDNPNLDEIFYGYRVEDVDEFFDNLVKEMVGDT